ncbi:YdeI/OmpD-associated family protein [Spirosoma endbachense]|uniref:Bacteriocin-protection protein n=1 Tax=Spirosoma endbachense TaxID=2666025 RepID=A0A6P1VYI9_9BACT|nr:hypothetical protein [Spirosoma endbachense]QHV97694.1 hypothetical protein GJR95_22970 [Spirosoma endbachense]
METNKGIETVYVETREQWRQWLEKNGQSKTEICLILYNKDSKTKSVNYSEAVEEALCFGWIDSLTNKRDTESRYQRFSPRKPRSNWSKSNRERVDRMIQEGLMTESGQKMIDIAKNNGRWEPILAD